MVSLKRRAWKESDHPRRKSGERGGEFTDVPGVEPKKVNKNKAFFEALSRRVGATDTREEARKKLPTQPKKVAGKSTAKKASTLTKEEQNAKTAAAVKAWQEEQAAKKAAKKAAADKAAADAAPKVAPAKKAAPAAKAAPAKKAAPAPVKVAGPATLPKAKKAAPAAPADDDDERYFARASSGDAARLQKQMLKARPWTKEQKHALRSYTGDDYIEINEALRKFGGKHPDSPATEGLIRDARAGLRPIPEDVQVFRAMGNGTAFGFSIDRAITRADLDALVGRSFHDPGFSSTSINDASFGPTHRIQAVIDVPAGTRGAFVDSISQNEGEEELVLDAGTRYKIKSYTVSPSGRVKLHMEVIPDAEETDPADRPGQRDGRVGRPAAPAEAAGQEGGKEGAAAPKPPVAKRAAAPAKAAAPAPAPAPAAVKKPPAKIQGGTFAEALERGKLTPAETEKFLADTTNFTDPKSGVSAKLVSAVVFRGEVTTEYEIFDADGNQVGSASRKWRPPDTDEYGNDRPVNVEHTLFKLEPSAQGNGFAGAWNRHMEELYREQGVEEIHLTANVDIGGYAWAKQGYGWADDDGRNMRNMAEYMLNRIEEAEEEELWPKAALAKLKQYRKRLASGKNPPTPLEISMVGWKAGLKTWPGKDIMLGSEWEGVKKL